MPGSPLSFCLCPPYLCSHGGSLPLLATAAASQSTWLQPPRLIPIWSRFPRYPSNYPVLAIYIPRCTVRHRLVTEPCVIKKRREIFHGCEWIMARKDVTRRVKERLLFGIAALSWEKSFWVVTTEAAQEQSNEHQARRRVVWPSLREKVVCAQNLKFQRQGKNKYLPRDKNAWMDRLSALTKLT